MKKIISFHDRLETKVKRAVDQSFKLIKETKLVLVDEEKGRLLLWNSTKTNEVKQKKPH